MENEKSAETEAPSADAAHADEGVKSASIETEANAAVETAELHAAQSPSETAPSTDEASGKAESAPAEDFATPSTDEASAKAESAVAAAEAPEAAEAPTEAAEAPTEATEAPAEAASEPAPEEPPPVPEAEPPHIENVVPNHGPVIGGTTLEITGLRFAPGVTVRFGDAAAKTTFESDTRLTVVAPERATFGYVDVRVENPDGKSEARVHGFLYDTPPLPEFVKPETLSLRGGMVRVFGEAFAEGITASIAGVPVPLTYKGDDCIELMIPAGDHGPVEIVIANPDGQSAILTDKLKLSEGPVIEGVSPPHGLPMGGTRVTVMGRNFARGCTITLFGTLAPEVTFDSDKKLFFTAPPHEPASGSVRLTNLDGLTTILESAFEYRAAPSPAVSQVSPDRAWASGGSRLLVSGSDFAEGCTTTIGGKEATTKWKNGGLLEVIVPPTDGVGGVELVVQNPDSQSGSAAFTYERVPTPPKLISVTPSRGPTHGNIQIILTGDNFDEQTVVRIAEVRTTTKVISKTEMEVLVPPRVGEGPVAIELTSAEGVAVRSEDVFYYNDQPPPRVTGVAPTQGPTSGNTRVTIEGDGFTRDCWVRIGRERPKSTTFKGSSAIEIVTPPCKTTGFVDIEVGTNQTGSSTAKNAFRFIALPPPTIDSVAPNRGSVNGGTELSISGKNFNADVIVTINGKQLKYKLISPDLIETKTPPGNDGQMVDVSVKNADGKEAMIRRAFAYDARYRQ